MTRSGTRSEPQANGVTTASEARSEPEANGVTTAGPSATRWLLWLAALIALPVPILGIGSGSVPPLHHLELGVLALAFTVLERAQGIGPLLSALFMGQALAYGLALWLAAGLAARGLSRLPPLTRTRAAFFLVALGLALAIAQPIYRTPYSSRAPYSNLLDVYR